MLRWRKYFLLFSAILFLSPVSPLYAEVIKLKSGRIITAPILERQTDYIKIDFEGIPLTFHNDEVESIAAQSSPSAPAQLSAQPSVVERTATAVDTIDDKLIQRVAQAVVVISTDREDLPALLGTGVFVSSDGLVVTNLHVVFKARAISIKMKNGEKYPVSFVTNYDADRDICILKVDVHNVPALPLGDSDKLSVGQNVLTVGHPQGEEYQSAAGQYIGKRTFGGNEYLLSIMKTESGNSGGPIVDSAGQLIGISTSANAKVQGYNYGIPINQVKKFFESDHLLTVAQFNTHINKVQMLVYYAKEAQEAGDNPEAVKIFKQALELDPDCLKAWIGLGEIYREMDLNPEGFNAWQEVNSRDLNNADAHAYLGKEYLNRGEVDQAIAHLQTAVDLIPQPASVYNDLGFAYGQKGMNDKAIVAYKKAITVDPQFAMGYFNLAAAYYNEQDFGPAKTYCAKAVQLGYDVPESFLRKLEDSNKRGNIFKFK